MIGRHGWVGAVVTACLVLGVAAAPASAEDAPLADLEGSAKLEALIDEVSQRQQSLETLRAAFVQVKDSELLAEPVESTGTLLFQAPDRVRWNYDTPEPMVILVADGTLTTYHPELARAEVVKVSRSQRRLVGVIAGTQSLRDMQARFRTSLSDRAGEPYRLTLEPTTMAIKRRLATVHIEVDRELLLPVMVEYLEADGDRTRYVFSDLDLNPELAEAEFQLELADDVVVENLDATSGD